MMIIEGGKSVLIGLTIRQVDHLFGISEDERMLLQDCADETLQKCEYCFSKTPNKYYNRGGEVYFNPYHSVQYMTYLYFFANTIYRVGRNNILCDKLYYLNKTLNSIDLFYAVEMPAFFMAEHPVGSVIGRASFGEGLFFYQNCTVGGYHLSDNRIVYPVIGNDVTLYAGASVIGNCHIGNHVNIAAGALVKNQDIPDHVNVFGQSPNLVIKPLK